MNLNELNVHKSTPFLCLHNSFLKKLTLQYFSVVVCAVSPEAICHGSHNTVFSLSISLMLSLSEKSKLQCLTMSLHSLHLICESFLFFNLPKIEHLGFLSRKLNPHRITCCYLLSFTCLGCL